MIIDIVYGAHDMQLSFVDKNKDLQFIETKIADRPYQYPIWKVAPAKNPAWANWKNWDGQPVEMGWGPKFNLFDQMSYLHKYPEAVKQDTLFASHYPKCVAMDFEMEIQDGFPGAEQADTPICSAAFTNDDPQLSTLVLTLDQITAEDCQTIERIVNEHIGHFSPTGSIPVRTVWLPDEKTLLKKTCEIAKPMPFITGWNFTDYDMTYWINRLKRYRLDLSLASPAGQTDYKGFPRHKVVLDYMELFKEHAAWMIGSVLSYSLSWISQKLLGVSKLDYKGMTLKELREKDLPRFLAYNAIDTILVQLIHRQVNTAASVWNLANLSQLPVLSCLPPTMHSAAVVIQYWLEQENVVCAQPLSRPGKRNFEGGFVKDPAKHAAKQTVCWDYSGLYPSIMRTLNLSPSNFVRRLKPYEVEEYKNKSEWTVTVANGLYKNDQDYEYKIIQDRLEQARNVFKEAQFFTYQKIAHPIKEEMLRRGMIKSIDDDPFSN